MYITLTNSSENHRGDKISINSDLIATVHSKFVTNDNGVIENKTYIFCPPHGTWEVSEALEDVIDILNKECQL
jgi:acetyltransferase-like isoleucine patch superfamily enzyme